jgi:hypothetical protein
VLAGFLLGTGIQVNRLREISEATRQALVDGFIEALHTWALVGGFAVVGMIVLAAVLARRGPAGALSGVSSADGQEQVVIPAPTPSPEGENGTAGEQRSDR